MPARDYNKAPTETLSENLDIKDIVKGKTRKDSALGQVYISRELSKKFYSEIQPPLVNSDHNCNISKTEIKDNFGIPKFVCFTTI